MISVHISMYREHLDSRNTGNPMEYMAQHLIIVFIKPCRVKSQGWLLQF
jgi:hypothetical protein